MKNSDEKAVLGRLIEWAKAKPDIRAVLLTSSRSQPDAALDEFSDYDVILAVNDIQPYIQNDGWLEDFGKVLICYKDPVHLEFGFPSICRVTHYWDFTKMDYTVWPAALLKHIATLPELPDYLDDGYKALLDKDGLAINLRPPTYKAYILKPPAENEYLEAVNTFYSDATYVGKNLYRDNLFIIKECLDHVMKSHYLRLMLEWLMEIENGWQVKTGAYGKGLKKLTKPELWAELESTYVGAGQEENWEALFKTITLFSKAAREVGKNLGYTYPENLQVNVVKYLQIVKTGAFH
jgi:aminoglycoside 6-adenylyltransferase